MGLHVRLANNVSSEADSDCDRLERRKRLAELVEAQLGRRTLSAFLVHDMHDYRVSQSVSQTLDPIPSFALTFSNGLVVFAIN